MAQCTQAVYSNDYADFILDDEREQPEENACYDTVDGRWRIAYEPRQGNAPMEVASIGYSRIPGVYGLMAEGTEGFERTGNYRVAGPPLSLTGTDVVIAFIDTGINYADELFRHSDGTSRILAIWDQNVEEGPAPEGFSYGREYTRQEINQALQQPAPYSVLPSRDENGHGSALAGVAAGRNREFTGAAPDAELVVVKLKQAKPYLREFYLLPGDSVAFQENDVMLAVAYVQRFLRKLNRPVVICIGIGTNQGDHSGQSPLGQYLDDVARQRGMAAVVCGGNEGNAAHHFRGELIRQDYGQPDFLRNVAESVEIRVSEGCLGFCMELWGAAPDVYTISVQTPGGEQTPQIRYGVSRHVDYSFVFERSSVSIDSVLSEGNSGEELIFFRIVTPTPGIWTVKVTTVEPPQIGIFHMWLPIEGFINVPVSFLRPNPYTTLTEPAMTVNTISVSTYNPINNSFYINSGRGYSRIGGVNPQLSAPGVAVATGRGTMTGSGIAAALAAGTIAQFMQWAVVEGNIPLISNKQLKSIFIRGAARERDELYPNREWGYGRMDIEGSFRVIAGS